MDKILQAGDVQDRAMTWDTLAYEAGLENVSARTVKNTMGSLDYHKCVACQKAYVSPHLAERRKAWAKTMLERYPNPEDWKHVRFSDEVHFSLGPQGRLMIIRRPGERHCPDCTQTEPPQKEADKKRVHAWGSIGWDFKSSLKFYEIPSNKNGKMT